MEPLSDNCEDNARRFIPEVIASGCVWGLSGPEGWALCASERSPEIDVMPFWSAETFARNHCADDWADYEPVAIDLMEYLEDWLPGMHKDIILVGINWNADLEGDELEPLDLLDDIDRALP